MARLLAERKWPAREQRPSAELRLAAPRLLVLVRRLLAVPLWEVRRQLAASPAEA